MNAATATTGPILGDNPVFDSAVVIGVPATLGLTVGKTTATAAKDFPGESYVSTWAFDFTGFASTVKINAPYNIVLDLRKPAGTDRT